MADVHVNKRVEGEDGPDIEAVNLDLDGGMRLLGPRPSRVDASTEPAPDPEGTEPLADADVLDGPAAMDGIDFSQIEYVVGDAAHVTISQAVSNLTAIKTQGPDQTQSPGESQAPALPAPGDGDGEPQQEPAEQTEGADTAAVASPEQAESGARELPEPDSDALDQVRARSGELAEIVRAAGPLRPTTPAGPGQISHEHRSVLGLIRSDRNGQP